MAEYKKDVTEYSDIRRCITHAGEKAFKKGFMKGFMEGREEERQEHNFLFYTNLRKARVSNNMIPELMGLTKDQVLELETRWRNSQA